MAHSGQLALALIIGPLLALPHLANAIRDASSVGGGASAGTLGSSCESQEVCVVSANAATHHPGKLHGLFEACLKANAQTKVVALALQDFTGDMEDEQDLPKYVRGLPGLGEDRFKMRHALLLDSNTGSGNLCYAYFKGGWKAGMALGAIVGFKVGTAGHAASPAVGLVTHAVGAAVGAGIGALGAKAAAKAISGLGGNCGGVAVFVYSLQGVKVEIDKNHAATVFTGKTASTKKGTVAAKFEMNGRSLVIASTHGAEGVRGKDRKKGCDTTIATEEEKQRVQDFGAGLEAIRAIRSTTDGAAAIWAGDFNARSVTPAGDGAGCPIWPQGGKDGSAEDLMRLSAGREVLGFGEDNEPVYFQSILQGSGLREADNLKCPTYKKIPQPKDQGFDKDDVDAFEEDKEADDYKDKSSSILPDDYKAEASRPTRPFQCEEDGETMFYKVSHPPSWVDRIFYSDSSDAPWLTCGKMHRVTHQKDHDAVLLTCSVAPGGKCR